jgi:hypothetical protein
MTSFILEPRAHFAFAAAGTSTIVCGSPLDDSLLLQIIDNHISAERDPAPPKPHHLALVSLRHGRLCSSPSEDVVHEHHPLRKLGIGPLPYPLERLNRAYRRRQRRIEEEAVLSQDVRRSERVQRHWTGPATLPLHQLLQPKTGPVVERPMVRMLGYAARIKGDESVYGGRWGGARRILAGGRFPRRFRGRRGGGGKQRRQHLCDL